MSTTTMGMLARAVEGRLTGTDAGFDGVSTDSRSIDRGQLFVALTGPNFDGHDFIDAAAARGAAGALVSRDVGTALPQVLVEDTLEALGAYASAWRARFVLPVVGVTGSNGKTTVKEMIACILRQQGPVLANRGNLNNEIGVPLTLLDLESKHRAAVIEMGAARAGDIAHLAQMVVPSVGIITNAGPAHLEGFGTVEGVARAKGELFASLPRDGTAVINAADPHASLWRDIAGSRTRIEFALDDEADFCAHSREVDALGDGAQQFTMHAPGGSRRIQLPLAGVHNVANALAAAAAASAAGASLDEVADGLACIRVAGSRMRPLTAACGARVLDDSYNANPVSLEAALVTLGRQPGRHWLALGDMLELGADARSMHHDAGIRARETGVERMYALGELAAHAAEAFGEGGEACDSMEQMIDTVSGDLVDGVCLLVKGSRGMRMERLVEALCGG